MRYRDAPEVPGVWRHGARWTSVHVPTCAEERRDGHGGKDGLRCEQANVRPKRSGPVIARVLAMKTIGGASGVGSLALIGVLGGFVGLPACGGKGVGGNPEPTGGSGSTSSSGTSGSSGSTAIASSSGSSGGSGSSGSSGSSSGSGAGSSSSGSSYGSSTSGSSGSSTSSGSSGGSTLPGCSSDAGCAGSRCPTTLAYGQNPTGVIALDGTYVYWTSAHDGTVMKASIAGGGPAILASGQYSPNGIVVDSVNAYWIAGGSLWRVTTGGGTGQLLDTGGRAPAALVLAYPYLFIAFDDSSVVEAPSGGGALTPIVPAGSSTLYGAGPFTVDATSVYGSDGNTIGKTPIAGGTTITLASGQNGVARMAVDATNIYWTATNDGTVMKAPLDGSGPPVALAVLQNYPTGIAVDSTSVYWTNHSGAASCAAGAVMKVAIGGGMPVALATDQPSADGIAVDSVNVYWTTGGSQDPAVANGAVMKLALE